MKTDDLKKVVEKIIEDKDWDMSWSDDYDDVIDLSEELERLGVINFSLVRRNIDSDYWLQAEYYSRKIQKTIIWDYDYYSSFEGIDDFVENITITCNEIGKFEKRLELPLEDAIIDENNK